MRHPHVVSLVDVLEISNESFATVLEYCEGGDLDSLLRDHGVSACRKDLIFLSMQKGIVSAGAL